MPSNLLIGLTAAIALVAGLLVHGWMNGGSSAAPQTAMATLPAPAALRDLDGKPHDLAEWRGKVLVVNFWASWCGPCREEMPEFVRLQNELGGKGLQFVGIALDETEAVMDFLKESPVNYPILIGGEGVDAWAESLGNRYGVLPFSAVFDREGKLAGSHAGSFSKEELLKLVEPLLGT